MVTIKSSNAKSIEKNIDYEIWHKRLGHPSREVLTKIPKNMKGYKEVKIPTEKLHCEGCLKGKMKAQSYKHSFSRAIKPFELIHIDVMYVPATSYHIYEYCHNCQRFFFVYVDRSNQIEKRYIYLL